MSFLAPPGALNCSASDVSDDFDAPEVTLTQVRHLRDRMQSYMDDIESCGGGGLGEDDDDDDDTLACVLSEDGLTPRVPTAAGIVATPVGQFTQAMPSCPDTPRQHVPRAEYLHTQRSLQNALGDLTAANEKTAVVQEKLAAQTQELRKAEKRIAELEKTNRRLLAKLEQVETEKAELAVSSGLTGAKKFVFEKTQAIRRRRVEREAEQHQVRFRQRCQELVTAQELALMHAEDMYLQKRGTGDEDAKATTLAQAGEQPLASNESHREYLQLPNKKISLPNEQYVNAKVKTSDYAKFLEDMTTIVRGLGEGVKGGADMALCAIERQLWPAKGQNHIPRATYGKMANDFMLKGKMQVVDAMRKLNETLLVFVSEEKEMHKKIVDRHLARIGKCDAGTSPDPQLGKTQYELKLEEEVATLKAELKLSRANCGRQTRVNKQLKEKFTLSLTYLQDWVMVLIRAAYRNLHVVFKHRYKFISRHVDHTVAFTRSPEFRKPRTDMKYNFQMGEMIAAQVDTLQRFGEYFGNSNIFGCDMTKGDVNATMRRRASAVVDPIGRRSRQASINKGVPRSASRISDAADRASSPFNRGLGKRKLSLKNGEEAPPRSPATARAEAQNEANDIELDVTFGPMVQTTFGIPTDMFVTSEEIGEMTAPDEVNEEPRAASDEGCERRNSTKSNTSGPCFEGVQREESREVDMPRASTDPPPGDVQASIVNLFSSADETCRPPSPEMTSVCELRAFDTQADSSEESMSGTVPMGGVPVRTPSPPPSQPSARRLQSHGSGSPRSWGERTKYTHATYTMDSSAAKSRPLVTVPTIGARRLSLAHTSPPARTQKRASGFGITGNSMSVGGGLGAGMGVGRVPSYSPHGSPKSAVTSSRKVSLR